MSDYTVERLAYFIGLVDAMEAEGFSPGYGRIEGADAGGVHFAFSVSQADIERIVASKPDLLATARLNWDGRKQDAGGSAGTGDVTGEPDPSPLPASTMAPLVRAEKSGAGGGL